MFSPPTQNPLQFLHSVHIPSVSRAVRSMYLEKQKPNPHFVFSFVLFFCIFIDFRPKRNLLQMENCDSIDTHADWGRGRLTT